MWKPWVSVDSAFGRNNYGIQVVTIFLRKLTQVSKVPLILSGDLAKLGLTSLQNVMQGGMSV